MSLTPQEKQRVNYHPMSTQSFYDLRARARTHENETRKMNGADYCMPTGRVEMVVGGAVCLFSLPLIEVDTSDGARTPSRISTRYLDLELRRNTLKGAGILPGLESRRLLGASTRHCVGPHAMVSWSGFTIGPMLVAVIATCVGSCVVAVLLVVKYHFPKQI